MACTEGVLSLWATFRNPSIHDWTLFIPACLSLALASLMTGSTARGEQSERGLSCCFQPLNSPAHPLLSFVYSRVWWSTAEPTATHPDGPNLGSNSNSYWCQLGSEWDAPEAQQWAETVLCPGIPCPASRSPTTGLGDSCQDRIRAQCQSSQFFRKSRKFWFLG